MTARRVVVTGLGLISPVGNTVEEGWGNILAGQSGIRPIEAFDTSAFSVRIGGEVRDFDVGAYLPTKDARKMDPFVHYGIAAATDALNDSGLAVTEANAERVGVYIGSGIGGLGSIEHAHSTLLNSGPRRISPFFIPSAIINMVSGNLSILHGLRGPNLSMVTACTSGTHSIGDAARTIAYGDADAMLAGGAEAAITPLGLGGFAAARALSGRNDAPEAASRPWDRDRDGFVLADGAGILMLEELEHARRRGARIYCELAGYGVSGDAHHMTQPAENGDGARRCMTNALRDAGIEPAEVSYINAHGTSTLVGDRAEAAAIRTVLGDHAKRVPVSSTKSMTGHLLGAAGGVEAVFSVLAIRDQVAPPTINLDNPEQGIDLDLVPHTAREMPVGVVLSNSFGFGGTNGTVVFRRLS